MLPPSLLARTRAHWAARGAALASCAPGDGVDEAAQPRRAPAPALAAVRLAVEGVHGVDRRPAQRLGLPAAGIAPDPRERAEGGLALEDQIAQGARREVRRGEALPDVASGAGEAG